MKQTKRKNEKERDSVKNGSGNLKWLWFGENKNTMNNLTRTEHTRQCVDNRDKRF